MGSMIAKATSLFSKVGKCSIDVCPSCAQYVLNDMSCRTEWCCCKTSVETRHTDVHPIVEI